MADPQTNLSVEGTNRSSNEPPIKLSKITTSVTAATAVVTAVGAFLTITGDVIKKNPWLPTLFVGVSVAACLGVGALIIIHKRSARILGIAIVLGAPILGYITFQHINRLSNVLQQDLSTRLNNARKCIDKGERKTAKGELEEARKIDADNKELAHLDKNIRNIPDSQLKRVEQLKIEAKCDLDDGEEKHAIILLEDAEQINPFDPDISTIRNRVSTKKEPVH